MASRGKFITLEGIEGVGKTTAVGAAAQSVRDCGHDVVTTREPGGTQTGEAIRSLMLDVSGAAIHPTTELLMMFAARAQHLSEVIEPALQRGSWVVCDRFTDASYAYQGGGRGLEKTLIAAAENIVHPKMQPDLTLLLDADPETALGRVRTRGEADRFERETVEFFRRVREAYLERAKADTGRFAIIDATQAMETVHQQISTCISERLK